MNISNLVKNMNDIYNDLINLISSDEVYEFDYNFMKTLFDNDSIEKQLIFKDFLKLLSAIINNYHRSPVFLDRITEIIIYLKDEIKKAFSNHDIFKIFKNNKIALLILIKENVITMNKYIAYQMCNDKYSKAKYPIYFYKEIKPFINDRLKKQIEEENKEIILAIETKSQIFEQNRKFGENDTYICELIRNDSVEKFISHITKNNIPLYKLIESSIYETNSFLLDKQPSFIEYASFFGSIQIFRYLKMSSVDLPPSLWLYAIHSQNPEMIHLLEEENVDPDDESFKECIKESIKCHYNDFFEYIKSQYCKFDDDDDFDIISTKIKYHNYVLFPNDLTKLFSFYNFCRYNYVLIVDLLLETSEIDINAMVKNTEKNTDNNSLHVAIEKNNIDIVKLLLSDPKINVNIKSIFENRNNIKILKYEEKTSLDIAIEKNYIEIAKLLINHKDIQINYVSKCFFDTYMKKEENKSPLNLAIEKNRIDILKLMLACHNVDYNIKSLYSLSDRDIYVKNIEKTALHFAVEKENLEIIRILLKFNGVDVNIKTKYVKQLVDCETEYSIFTQKFK